MEIWEVIARESIRDLIARYNSYGDAGRMDDLMSVFTDDIRMDMAGSVTHGKSELREAFISHGRSFVAFAKASGARRDAPVLQHFTATHRITVESPTHATSVCYYAVVMAHGLDHWGTYSDTFRNQDGTWLIADRAVTVDGGVAGGSHEFIARAAQKAGGPPT